MITRHFVLNEGIKKHQELGKHTHTEKERERKKGKYYTVSIFLITFKIIIKILNFLNGIILFFFI